MCVCARVCVCVCVCVHASETNVRGRFVCVYGVGRKTRISENEFADVLFSFGIAMIICPVLTLTSVEGVLHGAMGRFVAKGLQNMET